MGCDEHANRVFAAKPPSVQEIEQSGQSSEGGRVVLFSIGDGSAPERLGLSLIQVPEVRDTVQVTEFPGSPPWVDGLALWQGRIIVALDLGVLVEPATPP